MAANTGVKIADSVLSAYFKEHPADIRQLQGGEINITYLITPAKPAKPGDKVILQLLGSLFNETVADDSTAVGEHLAAKGWAAPRTIKTRDGKIVHKEGAAIWRASTFINSSPAPTTERTSKSFMQYGHLLGKLHTDLSDMTYTPQHELPNFHKTSYYAKVLENTYDSLPDEAAKLMAVKLLDAYRSLPELPASNLQIIHGDPRTSNMLFNEKGEPFTYIDLDTVMESTIWIDIGDLLRSVAEDAIHSGSRLSVDQLASFTEGYLAGTDSALTEEAFLAAATTSMQQIAIELGMRYVNDIVDNFYFGYDETSYANRRDNHMARAETQWQIFNTFNKHPSREK